MILLCLHTQSILMSVKNYVGSWTHVADYCHDIHIIWVPTEGTREGLKRIVVSGPPGFCLIPSALSRSTYSHLCEQLPKPLLKESNFRLSSWGKWSGEEGWRWRMVRSIFSDWASSIWRLLWRPVLIHTKLCIRCLNNWNKVPLNPIVDQHQIIYLLFLNTWRLPLLHLGIGLGTLW